MCLNSKYFTEFLAKRRKIGPQAPPLTTIINKILQRYPEGGQILKVITNQNNMCIR